METEVLEYCGDPETEYPEHWNSFKVMTVRSEPTGSVESKRLVTAVEFHITHGSYFFIERPHPGPDWLRKVFMLLEDEGWQGHTFNEIRSNCRGEIEIVEEEDYTAVIDHRKGNVFHNRGKEGSGTKDDIEGWKDT